MSQSDPDVQSRIEKLATKANEGTLSEEERAEYKEYVEAVDLVGVLQWRARIGQNHVQPTEGSPK
jgi:hypothetical protein